VKTGFFVLALVACGAPSQPAPAPGASPPPSASDAPSATPFVEQRVTAWGLPPDDAGASHCVECTAVSGSLVPQVIQRIIHLNRARFRACYADARRRAPALAGRIVVRFTISRSGEVRDATIDPSSALREPTFETCLLGAFSALSFPQPEGGVVTVTYPMVFAPEP